MISHSFPPVLEDDSEFRRPFLNLSENPHIHFMVDSAGQFSMLTAMLAGSELYYLHRMTEVRPSASLHRFLRFLFFRFSFDHSQKDSFGKMNVSDLSSIFADGQFYYKRLKKLLISELALKSSKFFCPSFDVQKQLTEDMVRSHSNAHTARCALCSVLLTRYRRNLSCLCRRRHTSSACCLSSVDRPRNRRSCRTRRRATSLRSSCKRLAPRSNCRDSKDTKADWM